MQVLITLMMLAASAAYAETAILDGKQILQRMVKAMETTDYQGTVVFHKNNNLEAMKYFHSLNGDNRSHERLVSLNSPQREIVRQHSEVRCLFKATKRLIIDHRPYQHSFIVDVPKNIEDLLQSYNFVLAGEEDVAMVPSHIVSMQPKDDLRFLRKIWVTKAHFLPIKAVIYDLAGEILEQVIFTDIQVNKSAPDTVTANKTKDEPAQVAEEATNTAFSTPELPAGFKHIYYTRRPIHQSSKPVDHLILSDGLASVSVYLESNSSADAISDTAIPEGIHSVGAVNSISRNLGNMQITVLGEVPPATVKMIAEGIKVNSQQTAEATK